MANECLYLLAVSIGRLCEIVCVHLYISYIYTQIYILFIVVCSINTVSGSNICSHLPWSTDNNQNCTEGGIKRDTLFKLSFLPMGIGKFYSGDHFNGLFELIECFITLTSIIVWYICRRQKCQNVKLISDVLLVLALISCYALEIAHMMCSEQVEPFYIITIIISVILPCILRCCCCYCNNLIIIIVTVSIMLLLIVTDALMVRFFKENDGYGCPLID